MTSAERFASQPPGRMESASGTRGARAQRPGNVLSARRVRACARHSEGAVHDVLHAPRERVERSARQVSGDHVAPTSTISPSASRTALQTLREALQLFWTVADGYAKRRLLLALVLVAAGALLAALTPIALKLVVDSPSSGAARGSALTPLALVILYVLGQYLWRCSTELRMMFHGHAEQRVRRHIGRRLFEHLVRLPLRFHLERKTGAMGETAEQGLRGYQLAAAALGLHGAASRSRVRGGCDRAHSLRAAGLPADPRHRSRCVPVRVSSLAQRRFTTPRNGSRRRTSRRTPC